MGIQGIDLTPESEEKIIRLCKTLPEKDFQANRLDSLTQDLEAYPSEAMRSVLNQVRMAAERQSTILLLGETGSGKDYLARSIYHASRRASGPYFTLNCAAVTHEWAESELFGHERGSFTGADGRKRGLLELAEGGTLLLNEIGELSLPLQAKLLTFLDAKKFTRVGGEKTIRVNARLIAATNRDLEADVETGKFRRDLFYRLNVISIHKVICASNLFLKVTPDTWAFTVPFPIDRSLNDTTREMKAALVKEALGRAGGYREDAARLLKISRHSLKHYINFLGLNGN